MVMADGNDRPLADIEVLSLLEQHAKRQHARARQEAARQQAAESRVVYDEMNNQTQQVTMLENSPVVPNESEFHAPVANIGPMTASDDYHRQLKRLEEDNRKHIKYASDSLVEVSPTHQLLETQTELQLLEDQCRMTLHGARVEPGVMDDTQYQQESSLVSPQQPPMSPATLDYQTYLLLLEQLNKKHLLMARLEQAKQASDQSDTEKAMLEAQETARREQEHTRPWRFRRYRPEGLPAPTRRSSGKGKSPAQLRYDRKDVENLALSPITPRISLKRPRLGPRSPVARRQPSVQIAAAAAAPPYLNQPSTLDTDMADADSCSDTVSLASTESGDLSSEAVITTPSSAASQPQAVPARHVVLHRVKCRSYICDPRIHEDEPRPTTLPLQEHLGTHLRASGCINNLERWIRDRPDLTFIVVRTHYCFGEPHEAEGRGVPALAICPLLGEVRDAFAEVACRERSEHSEQSDAAQRWLAHVTEPDGDRWVVYEYPLEFIFHHRNEITDLEPQVERVGDIINWYEADPAVAELFRRSDSLMNRGLVSPQTIRFLYRPGEHVVSAGDDGGHGLAPACFEVRDWPCVQRRALNLDCLALLHNGTKLVWAHTTKWMRLPQNDAVAIADLQLCPLRYASDETMRLLQARGQKFRHLHRAPLFSYAGPGSSVREQFAPGTRFMIDGRPREGRDVGADFYRPPCPGLDLSADIADDILMLVPNRVWAIRIDDLDAERISLLVDNTSPVTWAANTLDSLVIPPPKRTLILALLSQPSSPATVFVLFHGPPGTGKSLAVAAAADELRRPLHRTTARGFVARADDFLRQVRRTRGVLHIDMADAPPFLLECEVLPLLQARHAAAVPDGSDDAGHAAVVVTTHYPASEAVRSAFAAVIRFPRLDSRTRARVWLAESGLPAPAGDAWGAGDADKVDPSWMGDLLRVELNGRQIGSAVAAARNLAAHDGTEFCWQSVHSVVF